MTGSGLKELSGLNSMQSLNLADTRLTDVGLREVAGLKSLEFLSLRGTQITDSGLRELAKLKSLAALWCLTGTSPREAANNDPLRFLVTDSGVAELRKRRRVYASFAKLAVDEITDAAWRTTTLSRKRHWK